MKGKERPKDIDVLIIYKEKEDLQLNYALKQALQEWNVDVTGKSWESLFDPNFIAREAFLEGYSIIFKRFIADGLGYEELVLLRYDLKSLNASQRVRFYYALNGRSKGDLGMLKRLDMVKVADGLLGVPTSRLEESREFLTRWKIQYLEIPSFIPKRITQSRVFRDGRVGS